MDKVLVFGHKNPDTDSICSAIAYANIKKKLGVNAEPVKLGEVNKETQFAFDYFKAETPRSISQVDTSVKEVILVDHNEFQQSVDNIQDVKIAEVIDHHRISNFETSEDRKSTRLNSSHVSISYAVFCLKKKRQRSEK